MLILQSVSVRLRGDETWKISKVKALDNTLRGKKNITYVSQKLAFYFQDTNLVKLSAVGHELFCNSFSFTNISCLSRREKQFLKD